MFEAEKKRLEELQKADKIKIAQLKKDQKNLIELAVAQALEKSRLEKLEAEEKLRREVAEKKAFEDKVKAEAAKLIVERDVERARVEKLKADEAARIKNERQQQEQKTNEAVERIIKERDAARTAER